MLTLVAAVLAYDRARDICDCLSSLRSASLRYAMSETRLEKDMVRGCPSTLCAKTVQRGRGRVPMKKGPDFGRVAINAMSRWRVQAVVCSCKDAAS